MSLFRVIGNNIKSSLAEQNNEPQDMATALGISLGTAHKILDGRRLLNESELKKIADFVECNIEDLMTEKNDKSKVMGIQCMGEFENPNNLNKFLDLIDSYMDCKEMNERIG